MIVDLGCFLKLWKLLKSVLGVSELSLFFHPHSTCNPQLDFAKSCGGRVRLPAVERVAVGLSKHLKKPDI